MRSFMWQDDLASIAMLNVWELIYTMAHQVMLSWRSTRHLISPKLAGRDVMNDLQPAVLSFASSLPQMLLPNLLVDVDNSCHYANYEQMASS